METEQDARQQRGLVIAATSKITKRDARTWIVPSQSDKGRYAVTISSEGKFCTCPDFELRQKPCKHVYAVQYVLFRETTISSDSTTVRETAAVRVTYAQNWPVYNEAQVNEKETFLNLLRDLCADVPEPTQTRGRPRLPLRDMIFAAAFKVYSTASARRFMTDLRDAQSKGLIAQAPHYNSLFCCLESDTVTPIIRDLVVRAALPLRTVETDFAIDSTGFTSTQLVGLWQQEKYGAKRIRTEHHWVKRSNAESTFSAIKRVFGDSVRSRTHVAQVNEVLLKVLAHNIRCLIHATFELGINPSFIS